MEFSGIMKVREKKLNSKFNSLESMRIKEEWNERQRYSWPSGLDGLVHEKSKNTIKISNFWKELKLIGNLYG